jgi:carbamoyl-phosphate synthase small subunit
MGKGYLVLETGDFFEGNLIGNISEAVGEVVFNTSMTGYQEIMTDPSYAGQIVTFCYPLIGNYGINELDDECNKPHLAGVVIGDMCQQPSHYLAARSFSEQLEQAGVAGITGVDTRALVKLIRQYGTLRGVITNVSPYHNIDNQEEFQSKIKEERQMNFYKETINQGLSTFWVGHVSTKEIKTYENSGPHVVLIDYGYKKSILTALIEEKCKVTIVPHTITYEQMKFLNPDGVVFSNGPGDPMSLQPWFSDIKRISKSFASLGICLGHQLIALAHGAKTEKLKYGHRGGNHPVKELETGKVRMTSQNHGYVVVDESIDQQIFKVTYRNVNDKSIEGLKHSWLPIQTVQFHPEAHPGPSDTAYIFEAFIHHLRTIGEMSYAVT